MGFTADEIQRFAYYLSFTYAACSRSVGLVPPVYYAHKIALRARLMLDAVGQAGDTASVSSGGSNETQYQLRQVHGSLKNQMFWV